MSSKNYLNMTESKIMEYKTHISYIEKLLKEYISEDKVHLYSIHKKLKEKLKNLEAMLEKLRSQEGENKEDLQEFCAKYFKQFNVEFDDFLIILRWSQFSSIHIRLNKISEGKPSVIESGNYKSLLTTMDKSIKKIKTGILK